MVPTVSTLPIEMTNPLAVIDLDSTGINPEISRIIRISILLINRDGKETYRSELINPETLIPESATAINGITDDDVNSCPPFRSYARGIKSALEGYDLLGFGIERFHLPLLQSEFRRTKIDFSLEGRSIIDTMAIFHRLEPRDFNAALKKFSEPDIECNQKPNSRTQAILRILTGELKANPDLPRDIKFLERWSKGIDDTSADDDGKFIFNKTGEIILNFGKYQGEALEEVIKLDTGYIEWIAGNLSFKESARLIAKNALSK